MYYERSRLHRSLFNAAASPNGPGQPVETFLGARVESASPESAQITLSDGRIVRGDVVIGADGFHVSV
jgi:salicylate hydroxylase